MTDAPAPSVATLYFGGAGDDRSGIVRQFHDTRPQAPRVLRRYFLHHQALEARRLLARLGPAGTAIILVGHSWGADTAARIARAARQPVHLLIGVDPVAKPFSRLGGQTARSPGTARVITVDGGGEINGWGDLVKSVGLAVGGGMPDVFEVPDLLIRALHRHDDFAPMLAAPGAAHPSALAYLEKTEAALAR